jgi:hypothetical protein
MPNHEAVQLVPGTAVHRSAIAELVWSTGPSSYSYIFGARGVFDAFVERSWLAPGTYFGHSEATVALCDGRVAGIEIGFTGRRNYEAKDNLGAVSAGLVASGIVTERDLLAILTRAERASYLNPFVPAHAYYVLALAVVPAMRARASAPGCSRTRCRRAGRPDAAIFTSTCYPITTPSASTARVASKPLVKRSHPSRTAPACRWKCA